MNLAELAEKYRTDKVASIWHDYIPIYESLLRGRHVKRVLEIGIGTPLVMNYVEGYRTGASLRMWREFFLGADIVGLDYNSEAIFGEDHISTMICNQSLRSSLEKTSSLLGGKFDLIVDDGSHLVHDQALTAQVFIPELLSASGIYVIEDVMHPQELYPLIPYPTEVKFCGNYPRIPDECLFIIEGSRI